MTTPFPMPKRPTGPSKIRLLTYLAMGFALVASMVAAWFILDGQRIIANPTLTSQIYVVGKPPIENLIRLEVARTAKERRRGLMARPNIGEHQGMAFIYDSKTPASIWMHGTDIPLDIVFVDARGLVERVVPGRVHDDTIIYAQTPTSLVIEVPLGKARFYGLKPGAPVQIMPRTEQP